MSKLLYITANPKKVEDSWCLSTGEAFLTEYARLHPAETITRVDLFQKKLVNVDLDMIRYKFGKLDPETADPEVREKIRLMNETLDEFLAHDKYVFVTPLWNLGLPPVVKTYFDNVAVARKTFRYTPEGSVGLLAGRPALLIQASGGIYSAAQKEPFAHGVAYIRSILTLFGIPDPIQILIEGTNTQTFDPIEAKKKAFETAKQTAAIF
ncbi:MAG: NAD(P)H-dependent oxidoreductase [Fusobacteriaceae bacterium]|jgi:FMN-dependent NADH-azoreductase|nr:NAD(P)H-dependent oxidoreductase [Fusobacteriaceae bacterium]